MATSTSTGRAVRDIFIDPAFPKIGKNAKDRACKIVDKLLVAAGDDLVADIKKESWGSVYDSFTYLRRLIEIKEEACPT